jgi:hypothetical protein
MTPTRVLNPAISSGQSNGHGGARPGAGRKPKALTVAKREFSEHMRECAERAFAFVAGIVDDESQPMALRLQAAQEVMSRAWGRPRQGIEIGPPPRPLVDPEVQRRMLADPEAMHLACAFDERMAALYGPTRVGD